MPDSPSITDAAKSDRIKCIIRIVNLASGLVMIGFGIGGIIFMAVNALLNGKFFLVFSPVFMMYLWLILGRLFGIMIIAAQFKFDFVVKRFGFLQTLIGRGIFNIYLASTVFYYFSCCKSGDNCIQWLGWMMAIIMFVIGIVYFILYCCGGKDVKDKEEMTKEQMM